MELFPGTTYNYPMIMEYCIDYLASSPKHMREALRRGVALPFRKRDTEGNISELKACDNGEMMFQSEPGVYEKVHQIDFTSLYPSIIVKNTIYPLRPKNPHPTGVTSKP
jgi:hypothetical protein